MSFLTVHHTTVYRYREPVGLGEHRMMFRPRESHDLRLLRTNLVITPRPVRLRWLHDVFDNSVAVATLRGHPRTPLRKHGDAGALREFRAGSIRSRSMRGLILFAIPMKTSPISSAPWLVTAPASE
jgi:hypothetical protein